MMNFEIAAFWVFAAVTVLSACSVILQKNPVHAVLSLILTFVSTACLSLLLQAEFLGIVLVLVYVGAVMILFLFVVMMLDVNFDTLRQQFRSYLPIGAAVGALVLFEMTLVIVESHILEYHFENRGENVVTKPQLLAIGDRFEAEIAARRAADSAYR